jgi:hypothetical protein
LTKNSLQAKQKFQGRNWTIKNKLQKTIRDSKHQTNKNYRVPITASIKQGFHANIFNQM